MQVWHAFVEICCDYYQVDKHFFEALCTVESGLKGGPKIRFGRLGDTKYFGPGGLYEDCEVLKGLDLENPWVATWAAVRAVKGVGSDSRKQRRRLRNYNTEPRGWEDYWRAVKGAERRIRREDKLP